MIFKDVRRSTFLPWFWSLRLSKHRVLRENLTSHFFDREALLSVFTPSLLLCHPLRFIFFTSTSWGLLQSFSVAVVSTHTLLVSSIWYVVFSLSPIWYKSVVLFWVLAYHHQSAYDLTSPCLSRHLPMSKMKQQTHDSQPETPAKVNSVVKPRHRSLLTSVNSLLIFAEIRTNLK